METKGESKSMHDYFDRLEAEVTRCFSIAAVARRQGLDPEEFVDIKLAKNMAERVEGLVSTVAPQLIGTNFTGRIIELEKLYGALDWRVALVIAEEVAKETFCKFNDKREAMEVGIRAGFAYQTCGIVAAPLEGFIELKIKKRRDGGEYVAPCYAGPIRGAGGTAAAFSLLLTDFVRTKMGYAAFDPDENEIKRYTTEISDYHDRVTNLQYFPSPQEIEFLAAHLPVQIDGDPTETIEVSNYKDLPRIETNRVRGGVCLVLAEGLSQKAPKLWKRLQKWGDEFGLNWGFLNDFLALQKQIKSKHKTNEKKEKISPNFTFINDLVAGRPVLTHPMAYGGFRLRYGRTRVSGFSCACINPALMFLLNSYIATGTQLKLERPGKAASITPCDSIEGPIVKLKDGSVLQITSVDQAKQLFPSVHKILFLGDLLVSYGDFSENNHPLVPAGFNEDWWKCELEKATVDLFGTLDFEKLSDQTSLQPETINALFKRGKTYTPTATEAIAISTATTAPLHPTHTLFWTAISTEELLALVDWLSSASIAEENNEIVKIVLPIVQEKKLLIERIGLAHQLVNKEFVVIENDAAHALLFMLGYFPKRDIKSIKERIMGEQTTLQNINSLSGIRIMDRAGTFIGARMGRPEKAKMRKLQGSPQVLFPIGEEGGRLRSFQSAVEAGKVSAEMPIYFCGKCKRQTVYAVCEACCERTAQRFFCKKCGVVESKQCKMHGPAETFMKQEIDITHYFENAVKKLNMATFPDLIKGVRGTSNKDHIPENLVKGVLRAKHDLYVNKDGTMRFDMTELPITHFTSAEIGTSVEKLKELGYLLDTKGRPLERADQLLEIKPQDIIMPAGSEALDEQSDIVLLRMAKFVDELLTDVYGLEPFYNAKTREDLIGHVVIGLAPHISAGMVGRIVGFSKTQGMFAHPLYHAALRRDCDGDEACVILLMDGVLNFSRQFLPNSRGAKTMDAPLVLTSKLNPMEVDDMAHGLDIVWNYPLELYKAALEYKPAGEVKIDQIKHYLGNEKQYEGMGFTHDTSSMNIGVNCSAYKALPSMEEKLKGQMEIAERIAAVDEADVAKLVLEKHLLKDTRGNLRKFSTQQFRCVKCNEKFRRPPLVGVCTKCGGKIIFTVSEGSVVKYLEPSMSLANKYNLPTYLKQSMDLLKTRIEGLFGKEREIQQGLGKWFG
jgi:DNA polymerase II large subunit